MARCERDDLFKFVVFKNNIRSPVSIVVAEVQFREIHPSKKNRAFDALSSVVRPNLKSRNCGRGSPETPFHLEAIAGIGILVDIPVPTQPDAHHHGNSSNDDPASLIHKRKTKKK